MLETYHAIAKRIHRVRWLLWTLVVGSLLGFGAAVFMTSGTAFFLGALVVLLWSLLMLATAQSFVQPVPAVDPSAGWFARLKARCWRGYLWVLAVATTVLGAFVIFLSIRSIALILRGPEG